MNEVLTANNMHIIFLLLAGIVLVVASIRLRVAFDGKYEIKALDLVLIVIPLVLFGVATGKIKDIEFFGVKTDLSQLTAEANTEIENQVSKVDVITQVPESHISDLVDTSEGTPKRGVAEVPRLIKDKTEVLSFRLGQIRYLGTATKTYFDRLYDSSYLRFIVINKDDNSLFGMYAAADLVPTLRFRGDQGYADFAEWLNIGEESKLMELPGFVPAESAVTVVTSKREALMKMEKLDRASLPVIDKDLRFVGTVDRAKLTASLILAVTDQGQSEK